MKFERYKKYHSSGIDMLEERYADTLDSIDEQIESLLADFDLLKNDLEVQ